MFSCLQLTRWWQAPPQHQITGSSLQRGRMKQQLQQIDAHRALLGIKVDTINKCLKTSSWLRLQPALGAHVEQLDVFLLRVLQEWCHRSRMDQCVFCRASSAWTVGPAVWRLVWLVFTDVKCLHKKACVCELGLGGERWQSWLIKDFWSFSWATVKTTFMFSQTSELPLFFFFCLVAVVTKNNSAAFQFWWHHERSADPQNPSHIRPARRNYFV